MTASYSFPHSHKLHGQAAFEAVYAPGVRKHSGPLTVFALPNRLPHCRFGLSTPRKVGIAVQRNRIKRLLREAFRLSQHDWPAGYDLIVVVRPHQPFILAEYQRLLFAAVRGLHLEWERRARRESAKSDSTPRPS